ncbi:hypothetical protein fugu_012406 [Takifugu bimaculatus]|uniref:Uncharacterized protein n=1 Tax=Takifugu bimaculatus TaxID=433685 RepID=A0A4Z2C5A6_9TELE|nr:hypothetical protein fugu_012406 [Takifugu bimaculatus]
MMGPKRSRPTMGPPGEDGPPFDIGPPGWGPPRPGGWGPRPPGGPLAPDGWGPLPPERWPPIPPEGWDPRGPPLPDGWGPPPPGGWGHLPPRGWGSRGSEPPDWVPRGPPPLGWGGHPEDWLRPPEDWRPRHPDDWRPANPDDWGLRHPEGWRMHPRDWSPPSDWRPEGPPELWGSETLPPGSLPPDAAAYVAPVPPPCIPPPGIPPPGILTPGIPPPVGFGGYPTGWTGEPVVEEVLPNPPPDQPEWIKALISAPPTESAPPDAKKTEEPVPTPATEPPTVAPRPKPTNKPNTSKALGLLGKRTFEKPPPGRSTGIISFIGPSFGYIEREDLQKYTFSFDVFFGNPKAMTPGVRVHFTACKEKGSLIATDVKVAPGGTENVEPEIYEAVVTQPIVEPQPGERQYPGQILTFDAKDSTVTLLKNDQVLINLLTDIVTEKRRATNIKPKIPSTFSETQEIREQGVIISLKDGEGVVKSEKHGELPFDVKENLSDVEFTVEDVNEEVEFTVITLRSGNRAIRIKRVKEPLLLTICSASASSASKGDNSQNDNDSVQQLQNSMTSEVGPNMKLDPELYEGVVTQTITEPSPQTPGYPGQIHANIGPIKTNVTFDHRDCGITLLKNDHVLINLLYNLHQGDQRAGKHWQQVINDSDIDSLENMNVIGVITWLSGDEGIVNSADHGELSFDTCENFSDSEFSSEDVHKEVEFTLALEKGKKRAIRLMRTKRDKDPILEEQKKREEAEKRKKKEEEEVKRKEEEQLREAERKRKEDAVAALEAAKCKVKIKVEKTTEDEKEEGAEEEERMEIKVEKEEDDKPLPDANAGRGS